MPGNTREADALEYVALLRRMRFEAREMSQDLARRTAEVLREASVMTAEQIKIGEQLGESSASTERAHQLLLHASDCAAEAGRALAGESFLA